MKETVEKLWQLQREMTQLVETQRALHEKPPEFAEVDQRYQQLKNQIDTLTAKMEEATKRRRDFESDLQGEQEMLKKYQGQLMQVKNQQQYAAAWKEIDTARKKVKELEDEALRKMTEIEELEKQLQEQRTAFEAAQAEYDVAHAGWQSSLGDLRAKEEQIRGHVKALESGIPERLRREFHMIFEKRQNLAVALVQEGSCTGCRVRIRPQVIQQLKRGELAYCEGCRRFLYLDRQNN